jgi:hypothetical protein
VGRLRKEARFVDQSEGRDVLEEVWVRVWVEI